MKRVPSHFKKSVFVLMVLGAAMSAHAQTLPSAFIGTGNVQAMIGGWPGTTSNYTNSPSPAPVASSNSPGNDVGCPNTSTKTGVYAPCVGYIAPGSTSAVGVHHLSAIPGVVVGNSMTTGQAAAKGLLPKALGTPSFGVMVAVSEAGGAGQQNPDSPAPPPPSCACGVSGGYTWSGWDQTGWVGGYSCIPCPPPANHWGGGGSNGPVLCAGAYCIQPDGTVTGPGGVLVKGYSAHVGPGGSLVVTQDLPGGQSNTVATFTGVGANTKNGQIEATSAPTGYSGSGLSSSSLQITTNVTNPNGSITVNFGNGWSYTSNKNNPNQGSLCDSSGNCSTATLDNGVLSSMRGNTLITTNVDTKTVDIGGGKKSNVGTSGVKNTTVTNLPTGQSSNQTNATATQGPSGGSSGSSY